jgi:hypothetical protein
MPDIVLCRVQYVTHGKEKGLTAVRGETTSHSLYRAPLRTHGNGSILCRALGSAAHGKDCFRRQVDQGLCRASHGGARQRMVHAHGGPGPLPCVVLLGAQQRMVQAPGGPGLLPCVLWRGARQRMVNLPPVAVARRTTN